MSMECLPAKVLSRILSYLTPYQLLRVEQVCQQWQSAIQEQVWSGLTSVTKEAIGYPEEDYLANFVRLATHLDQVTEFVNIFDLIEKSECSEEGTEVELRSAMRNLVGKRTPDAVFPLDAIKAVVVSELRASQQAAQVADIRAAAERVVQEFSVADFEAVRMNRFDVHSHQVETDPLTVLWKGKEVAVPVELSKVRRLTVGCLVIRLMWFGMIDSEAMEQAAFQLGRIAKFRRLESVLVESVQIVVPSPVDGEQPYLAMNLDFMPQRCTFGVEEFKALLRKMTHCDDDKRSEDLTECIRRCITKKTLKTAELSIHSEEFTCIEFLLLMGHTVDTNPDLQFDPFKALVGLVFPELIDKLHLTFSSDYDEEEYMLQLLDDYGVYARLKRLSVSFSRDVDDRDNTVCWDEYRGAHKARSILGSIKDYLVHLECLKIDFMAGGEVCPSSMFEETGALADPLPQLVRFECLGLPCFPFLIAVVSQAANLRYVVFSSQPFNDDRAGLLETKKLVEALHACSRLASLSIKVTAKKQLKWKTQRDPTKYQEIAADIAKAIARLVSSLAHLQRVSVVLDSCNYRFDWNRLSDFDRVEPALPLAGGSGDVSRIP